MSPKDRILEPFDFQKSPSMSSQLFAAAPGIFGDGDGLSLLQGANRVIVGGPLDAMDAVMRAMDVGSRGATEAIGEGYKALGGSQGMANRLKRDIYGLSQVAGIVAGSSPSALSGARYPSTKRAPASDSTLSGAKKAFKSPPKQKEKAFDSPSDFFEIMGDEGAGAEFPQIGKALDDYVYDMNRSGILKALKSDDYPEYQKVLRTNLDRLSSESKIPVSRTENYLDPMAGIEGRRTKRFFDVDKDDVLFVGSDAERELIVRGPDGSPMSVRFQSPDEVSKRKKFKDEFEYDVYHGQRDPQASIGVVRDPSGREMLVEDATDEFGGINAFESSADKFPSQHPTDLGTFVSESRDVANYFAGDKGAVYPLKMRMRNPMRYETYEDLEDALSEAGETSDLTRRLMDDGYDGIEITYSDTDIPEIRRDFVPFDGRQLRSINANFDPEKRDMRNITYKEGGIVYNPFKAGIGAL